MVDWGLSAQILYLASCLIWCSFSDLLGRRIPNRAVIIILLGWIAIRVWDITIKSAPLSIIYKDLPGAGIIFLVGFLLFLTGRLGAGDVKLMAVLCLWVGYGQQITFIMVTALVGGVLAIALPLLNILPTIITTGINGVNKKFKIKLALPPVLSPELAQGIPYGIAISAGAAYILILPYIS